MPNPTFKILNDAYYKKNTDNYIFIKNIQDKYNKIIFFIKFNILIILYITTM
jgi:hypothetical protein